MRMAPHPAVGIVIAASICAAAAVALYESEQARRFAEDIRRKLAVALHSLGDEINPQPRQPRFNRPEDAEGFLMSQSAVQSADPGIDADEESKRRQREELMYWNAVHLEKKEKDRRMSGARPETRTHGPSFDDFLNENGTYSHNTGTDTHQGQGLRNRGVYGVSRGTFLANPFSDEHNIEMEEQRAIDASLMELGLSEKDEVMSDLYSANDGPGPRSEASDNIVEQLIDTSDNAVPDPPVSLPVMESETNIFTNMSERDDYAYASIHAWADNTNNSFYSPLPTSPNAGTPLQEARPSSPWFSDPGVSVPGSGMATPTDSASLADVEEAWTQRSGATSEVDIMSMADGVSTPGTWTEVNSVLSEDDAGMALHH